MHVYRAEVDHRFAGLPGYQQVAPCFVAGYLGVTSGLPRGLPIKRTAKCVVGLAVIDGFTKRGM